MLAVIPNHWKQYTCDTCVCKEVCVLCRSTGKVANLTITATLSNCILHRQGKVTVEGCKLQCYAGGLEHLFTPLVTLAAAGLSKHKQARPVLTGREAGMGVLSVVETKIRVSPLALHVLHCCCVNGDAENTSHSGCCAGPLCLPIVGVWKHSLHCILIYLPLATLTHVMLKCKSHAEQGSCKQPERRRVKSTCDALRCGVMLSSWGVCREASAPQL